MATTDAPNTTTLAEGALQPTTTEQDKSRKVISLIDTLLTTPTAPTAYVAVNKKSLLLVLFSDISKVN